MAGSSGGRNTGRAIADSSGARFSGESSCSGGSTTAAGPCGAAQRGVGDESCLVDVERAGVEDPAAEAATAIATGAADATRSAPAPATRIATGAADAAARQASRPVPAVTAIATCAADATRSTYSPAAARATLGDVGLKRVMVDVDRGRGDV